jgi:hypothetical protein
MGAAKMKINNKRQSTFAEATVDAESKKIKVRL